MVAFFQAEPGDRGGAEVALDLGRSSGAGILLSKWCHSMIHCDSLECEHFSPLLFTPPAPFPLREEGWVRLAAR